MIVAQNQSSRFSGFGEIQNPIDFIVQTAKGYIDSYVVKYYQPPNCSEIAVYVGSQKPSSMIFTENDVQQAAFILYVYDQRTGTYDDWHYALQQLIGAVPTSNITVAGYAIDLGLSYNQLNPYPGQIIDLSQAMWDAVKSFALSQVSYLNGLYNSTMVLTDTLFKSLINQRGYFLAELVPIPEPEPEPEPTATNLQVLAYAVELGLQSAGISLQAASNTDLTSAEWDSISSVAFTQVPLLNAQYGTDLVITQSLIDNNLHIRKYWEAEPEPRPEPKPEPEPISNGDGISFSEKNKMLMLVLFAGAFFLAIFPGQSKPVPEGEFYG